MAIKQYVSSIFFQYISLTECEISAFVKLVSASVIVGSYLNCYVFGHMNNSENRCKQVSNGPNANQQVWVSF